MSKKVKRKVKLCCLINAKAVCSRCDRRWCSDDVWKAWPYGCRMRTCREKYTVKGLHHALEDII